MTLISFCRTRWAVPIALATCLAAITIAPLAVPRLGPLAYRHKYSVEFWPIVCRPSILDLSLDDQASYWLSAAAGVGRAPSQRAALAMGAAWMLDRPNEDHSAITASLDAFERRCGPACIEYSELAQRWDKGNRNYVALGALLLSSPYVDANDRIRPRVPDLLPRLQLSVERDPNNALYDYIAAEHLFLSSKEWDQKTGTFVVRNRSQFRQGCRLFLRGQRKPVWRSGERSIGCITQFLDHAKLPLEEQDWVLRKRCSPTFRTFQLLNFLMEQISLVPVSKSKPAKQTRMAWKRRLFEQLFQGGEWPSWNTWINNEYIGILRVRSTSEIQAGAPVAEPSLEITEKIIEARRRTRQMARVLPSLMHRPKGRTVAGYMLLHVSAAITSVLTAIAVGAAVAGRDRRRVALKLKVTAASVVVALLCVTASLACLAMGIALWKWTSVLVLVLLSLYGLYRGAKWLQRARWQFSLLQMGIVVAGVAWLICMGQWVRLELIEQSVRSSDAMMMSSAWRDIAQHAFQKHYEISNGSVEWLVIDWCRSRGPWMATLLGIAGSWIMVYWATRSKSDAGDSSETIEHEGRFRSRLKVACSHFALLAALLAIAWLVVYFTVAVWLLAELESEALKELQFYAGYNDLLGTLEGRIPSK